jgi:ATP-dependent Lhr-like helicase
LLYISPLKALGVDVERNLRAPLAGIRHTADRLSPGSAAKLPEIRVGVRSGDTTAQERRRLTSQPPDILITTPESLFLMLTSQARESLRGVDTVIVDEVHAVAGASAAPTWPSASSASTALLEKPASGSASPRPYGRSTRSPASSAATRPSTSWPLRPDKAWDLKVVVPVEDMTAPDGDHVETDGRRPTTAAAARSGRTSRSTSSTSSSSTAPPSSSPTPAASPSG